MVLGDFGGTWATPFATAVDGVYFDPAASVAPLEKAAGLVGYREWLQFDLKSTMKVAEVIINLHRTEYEEYIYVF